MNNDLTAPVRLSTVQDKFKHIRVAEGERRGIPMLQRGDKFRRNSDGRIFVLKTIMKNDLVLESEDGSQQIMTGKEDIPYRRNGQPACRTDKIGLSDRWKGEIHQREDGQEP